MATRGRPITVDHRNTSHRTIAVTDARRKAIARASALLGVSGETLIDRFISAGLSVLGES